MKTHKAYLISAITAVLVFALSMAYSFIFFREGTLIQSTVAISRFLYGIQLFLRFLPAVIGTGALVGWAIDFGKNARGCSARFSGTMFVRLNEVIVTGLVFVFVLTLVNEIALPTVSAKLKQYRMLPSLLRDYNAMAARLYEQERFALAFGYAKKAFEIDAKNPGAKRLLRLTELSLQQQKEISDDIKKRTEELTFKGELPDLLPRSKTENRQDMFDSNLLESARDALKHKDFVQALALAGRAQNFAHLSAEDKAELKNIAGAAESALHLPPAYGATAEQLIFQKKYDGYVSLLNGSYLKAYYIFKTLSLQSKTLALDPDIQTCLEEAQRHIENQCFFSDETFNLRPFERAENVHFRLAKDDGTTDIFFIKGITQADIDGGTAQYLRGLYVFTLDEHNEYKSGFYSDYAKLKKISLRDEGEHAAYAKALNAGRSKPFMSVPILIVRSIDRNFEGTEERPSLLTGEEGLLGLPPDVQALPMEYDDFELIKEVSSGFDSMHLDSLFRFVNRAENYGYSAEIFAQILLNRLLYPLFLLNLFIILGWIAWNGRTPEHVQFKFVWILLFPFAGIGLHALYIIMLGLFKLMNYGIIGLAGKSAALGAGLILYTLLLTSFSVSFLACRNSEEEE